MTELSDERLHEIGLKGVERMNAGARTKHMEPSGAKRPLVYVLGEAPGEREDDRGQPFIGKSGKRLRRAIPRGMERKARFDYVVRTRPPRNRTPTRNEIECYRPTVVASIERAQPRVILAVGHVATRWCLGQLGEQKVLRGRAFPAQIGEHRCWVYPIMHPAWIVRVEAKGKREDDVPAREWAKTFDQDVVDAFLDAEEVDEPRPLNTDKEALSSNLELVYGTDKLRGRTLGERVIAALGKLSLRVKVPLTVDVETTCLRPYSKDAKLLSLSIGDGSLTVAFPWDHPSSPMPMRERKAVKAALRKLITGRIVRAQNATMELEWLAFLFENALAMRWPKQWDDTMVMGYFLDERPGGNNLAFLTAQHLGVNVKALTDVDASDEDLSSVPIEELLYYNALDVKFTSILADELEKKLKKERIWHCYREHGARRLVTLAAAQWIGLPVDEERQQEFDAEYTAEIERVTKELFKTPGVLDYEDEYGDYNPDSTKQNAVLFRDVLERDEGADKELGKVGKSGYSTDEAHLSAMEDCEEARLVLERRRLVKLKGTYIDRMHRSHPEALVYPDGRLHTSFLIAFARSGRLSSRGPNNQNWPKRRDKKIRGIIAVRGKLYLVSIDYGQIEARVLGMVSKDQTWINMLWQDYDVHMEWAEKIASRWPRTLKECDGNIKALRSKVKNSFVFPLFYGAGVHRVATDTGVPERGMAGLVDEFWDVFKGIKAWQDKQAKFYKRHGYVECINGRRSRGPLSHNMVCNRPIQGPASDIVVNAMDRVSELSFERQDLARHPILNIHDDLTFIWHADDLEDAIFETSEMMVDVPYEWAKVVPITAEVEVGQRWDQMEEVCTISSVDLDTETPF